MDVDRLFSEASDDEKAEDFRLLRESASHLRDASEHWLASERACSAVASMVRGGESRLLREDVQLFGKLAGGAVELAEQMEQGKLPPNAPVHRLTALMRDQDVMAERRARAYQGLPGHLPEGY